MNDDNLKENVAYEGEAGVFGNPTPTVKRNRSDSLPPTSDTAFWEGDNKTVSVHQIEEQRIKNYDTMKAHKLKMYGQEFICESCPFSHTIDLDPRKFTLDTNGQIVSIDKP